MAFVPIIRGENRGWCGFLVVLGSPRSDGRSVLPIHEVNMMRIIALLSIGVVLAAGAAVAQAPESQPVGTMREFMASVVYPPTNELLLSMNRGAPANAKEWAAVQRSAIQLAESGNLLMMRGRAMDQGSGQR